MSLNGPPLICANPVDDLLTQKLNTSPDELALVSLKTRMTWRELAESSAQLANQYLALGLEPGDRVASLMPNRPALIIHYLACLRAGLVSVPLNYRYTPVEIDYALKLSGASLLFHHAERDEDIAATKFCKSLSQGVIRYKAETSPGRHYEELIDRPQSQVRLSGISHHPEAPAFIYFTSGSTGKPKGVTHTRSTFGWMMAAAIQGMELTEGDAFLPASSHSHIGGSLFGLSTLSAGGRLLIPRSGDGSEVLPLLRAHRPTVLFMLPAAMTALLRSRDVNSHDFSSIRLCLSGGDKVSQELEREFTNLAGFPIDESYGMTELGIATLNPPSGENRLGSIGRASPGYEMSLRDDAGREVEMGTWGRLWIRSKTNMRGYWNNPEATADTIVGGWLDTGDLMRADEQGYLWFCGRKKQMIVHDGSNICPQEIEEAVAEHPAVESVGVIGIHDLVHGENVRAYITIREGVEPPTAAELIAFARKLVGYKAPEEIVFLEKMPVNAVGKVDRVMLKKMAEDHLNSAASGRNV